MTAQRGIAFLLKLSDDRVPPGFSTVAGLRATRMEFNREVVPHWHKDGGLPDEVKAGPCALVVAATGIFLGSAAEARTRGIALAGEVTLIQLSLEDGTRLQGRFLIERLDYTGDFNGERNYAIILHSSEVTTL